MNEADTAKQENHTDRTNCPINITLENGKVSYNQWQFETHWVMVANHFCYSDYDLNGTYTRECGANGKWMDNPRVCLGQANNTKTIL